MGKWSLKGVMVLSYESAIDNMRDTIWAHLWNLCNDIDRDIWAFSLSSKVFSCKLIKRHLSKLRYDWWSWGIAKIREKALKWRVEMKNRSKVIPKHFKVSDLRSRTTKSVA